MVRTRMIYLCDNIDGKPITLWQKIKGWWKSECSWKEYKQYIK